MAVACPFNTVPSNKKEAVITFSSNSLDDPVREY
jgi:hypothetical protein